MGSCVTLSNVYKLQFREVEFTLSYYSLLRAPGMGVQVLTPVISDKGTFPDG